MPSIIRKNIFWFSPKLWSIKVWQAWEFPEHNPLCRRPNFSQRRNSQRLFFSTSRLIKNCSLHVFKTIFGLFFLHFLVGKLCFQWLIKFPYFGTEIFGYGHCVTFFHNHLGSVCRNLRYYLCKWMTIGGIWHTLCWLASGYTFGRIVLPFSQLACPEKSIAMLFPAENSSKHEDFDEHLFIVSFYLCIT